MKLHFMIVRRVPPVPSPVLVECYEILRGRGYTVTEDIAEEVIQRPDLAKIEADIYLLKSHTGAFAGAGRRPLHAGREYVEPLSIVFADSEQDHHVEAATPGRNSRARQVG